MYSKPEELPEQPRKVGPQRRPELFQGHTAQGCGPVPAPGCCMPLTSQPREAAVDSAQWDLDNTLHSLLMLICQAHHLSGPCSLPASLAAVYRSECAWLAHPEMLTLLSASSSPSTHVHTLSHCHVHIPQSESRLGRASSQDTANRKLRTTQST